MLAVVWSDWVEAIGTVLIPVVVVLLAQPMSKRLSSLEAQNRRGEALIQTRIELFQKIIVPLNALYCYFSFVGDWKDHTPIQVIELKRTLDRLVHTLGPLFDEHVAIAHEAFCDACFVTFGGWGRDARLNTGFGKHKRASGARWHDEWEERFALGEDGGREPVHLDRIRAAYNSLICALVSDISPELVRAEYARSSSTARNATTRR